MGFRHSTFGRVADLRPLASMDCALVGWSRGLLACDLIFMNCIGAVCTEILLLSALVDGSSHMAPSLAGCDEPPGTPLKQFVAQVQASAPKKSRYRTDDEVNQGTLKLPCEDGQGCNQILMRISIFVSSGTTSYRFRCSSRRGMISTKLHGRCL